MLKRRFSTAFLFASIFRVLLSQCHRIVLFAGICNTAILSVLSMLWHRTSDLPTFTKGVTANYRVFAILDAFSIELLHFLFEKTLFSEKITIFADDFAATQLSNITRKQN